MTPVTEIEETDAARRHYAEEIRVVCGLQSGALVRALATVPRERFLGPGPWIVRGIEAPMMRPRYQETPDASPRHVYHNVLVSIDPARELNNGHPGTLCSWIDCVNPVAGQRVLHVGCGTGYYTAIMAEMVGPGGRVTAIEIDPVLADRARAALAPWPNVSVETGDGSELPPQAADVLFVNAGATHPLASWLDALDSGGRMLLPLTAEPVPGSFGKGFTWLITRTGSGYDASTVGMVQIFPCAGARHPDLNAALAKALMGGGWDRVRTLRRDPHERGAGCWFHAEGFCLSA
jgi:protein-L-isoaspartate(D-aspartate) O-methyltransferase